MNIIQFAKLDEGFRDKNLTYRVEKNNQVVLNCTQFRKNYLLIIVICYKILF